MSQVNHVLITLDSCRWDSFEAADLPLLKSGSWDKCWSHATFTYAAHQAFFAGKLPHSFDREQFFDTAAATGKRRKVVQKEIWRLSNVVSPREAHYTVEGRNLKDGFRRAGYTTIGSGSMNWFNPALPAAEALCSDFDHYAYFPSDCASDGRNAERQIAWSLERIAASEKPFFLFLNLGETHSPYTAAGHSLRGKWGDAAACAQAQRASLEFLDRCLAQLFAQLDNYLAVVCGDHGDCWGEDDLWGHGFYHPAVLNVPMVVLDKRPQSFLQNCLSYIYPAA
jgi:hypothetical protein